MDEHTPKESGAVSLRGPVVGLYVDRSRGRWVIRDPDGNFWIVPLVDDPWGHREPFDPGDGSDLEPVPGHYRHMFRLPF
jgi:hypothetical protein